MSVNTEETILTDLLKRIPAGRFVTADAPGEHLEPEQLLALASPEEGAESADIQRYWAHASSCRACFEDLKDMRDTLLFAESEEALSHIDTLDWEPAPAFTWRQADDRPNVFQLLRNAIVEPIKQALAPPEAKTRGGQARRQFAYRGAEPDAERGDEREITQTLELPLAVAGGTLNVTIEAIGDKIAVSVTPNILGKEKDAEVGNIRVLRKQGENEVIARLSKARNKVKFEPHSVLASDVIQFICEEEAFLIELDLLFSKQPAQEEGTL